MPSTPPQLMARGDIHTCRFVKIDPANDQSALECGANIRPIGISYEGSDYPPLSDVTVSDHAARDAGYMGLYGEGDICLIEVGDAVVRGNLLKADANGRGVPILTAGAVTEHYGCVVTQSGAASGEKVRCQVTIGAMPAGTTYQ